MAEFSIVKVLEYGSHIRTIIELLTDAFNTGRTYEKDKSPTEAYKKMLDEAIGLSTIALLRDALEADCANPDHVYQELANYFQRHPIYIPALRESLAAVPDAATRVQMLKELAIASEAEKDMLCQMMDQRHPIAKALYERYFKAERTWQHIISRELPLADTAKVREFLESLSWLQGQQFKLSVGALSNAEDHMAVLDEVLASHPDKVAMRETAIARGLIKPSVAGKAAGEVVRFATQLATPRPHDAAELARARLRTQQEKDATRSAFRNNPFYRLFG